MVFVFCICILHLYSLQQSIFIFLSLLDCPGWQRGSGSAVAVSNDTTLLNDETFQNNYSNSLVMQKAQIFRPEDGLVQKSYLFAKMIWIIQKSWPQFSLFNRLHPLHYAASHVNRHFFVIYSHQFIRNPQIH